MFYTRVGAEFRAEQRACIVSASPPAREAGDCRGANRRTQCHEGAEYGPEQHAASRGEDRAWHEYGAEHR